MKCTECFSILPENNVYHIGDKKYCKSCYERKRTIISQTGGVSNADKDLEFHIRDIFI